MTREELSEELGELYGSIHSTENQKELDSVFEIIETLRAKLKKTVGCLMAYNEYFGAIATGEYDSNRRPAPLRDFEQLLLDKGRAASKEYRGEETKCTCPLLMDDGKIFSGVNYLCPIHGR